MAWPIHRHVCRHSIYYAPVVLCWWMLNCCSKTVGERFVVCLSWNYFLHYFLSKQGNRVKSAALMCHLQGCHDPLHDMWIFEHNWAIAMCQYVWVKTGVILVIAWWSLPRVLLHDFIFFHHFLVTNSFFLSFCFLSGTEIEPSCLTPDAHCLYFKNAIICMLFERLHFTGVSNAKL